MMIPFLDEGTGGLLDTLYGWLDADALIKGAFKSLFDKAGTAGGPGEATIVFATIGAALVMWGMVLASNELRRGGSGLEGIMKGIIVLAFIGFCTTKSAQDLLPNIFDGAARAMGGSDAASVAKKCGNMIDAFGASESKVDAKDLDAANSAKSKWYDLSGKVQGSVMRWVRVTLAKVISGLVAILVFIGVALGMAAICIAKFAYQLGWILMPMMVGFFAVPSLSSLGLRFVQGQAAFAAVNFIFAILHIGTEALLKMIGFAVSKSLSGNGIAVLERISTIDNVSVADRAAVLAAMQLAPMISWFVVLCLILILVFWLVAVSFFGFNVGRSLLLGGELRADNLAKGAAGAVLSSLGNGMQMFARGMARESVEGSAESASAASNQAETTAAGDSGDSPSPGAGSDRSLAMRGGGQGSRSAGAIRAASAALRVARSNGSVAEQRAAAREAALAEGLDPQTAEEFADAAVKVVNAAPGNAASGNAGSGSGSSGGAGGRGPSGGGGASSSGQGASPYFGGGEGGQRGRSATTSRSRRAAGVAVSTLGAAFSRAGGFVASGDEGTSLANGNSVFEEGADLYNRARAEFAQAAEAEREQDHHAETTELSRQQVALMRRLVERA